MGEVDAVVNLSGASIARLPWTPGYRQVLVDSRVRSTQALAEAMNMVATPPKVFLSASGVSVYGDRPGVRITDGSPPGDGLHPGPRPRLGGRGADRAGEDPGGQPALVGGHRAARASDPWSS